MKKILLVLGTRPEAIKLAPLAIELRKQENFSLRILSTGQHREMLAQVLSFFGLEPDADLRLMQPGQAPAEVLQAALAGVKREIQDFRPDWVIAQGDTTTAMASGLSAFYEQVKFAHVEAGLRTHNLHSPWPEEFNRRVLTLCSALHFAPTGEAKRALVAEGVPEAQIHLTGNTGIDALLWAKKKLSASPPHAIVTRWGYLQQHRYVLCTLHRRESFGQPLRAVLRAIRTLTATTDLKFVFPVHRNPEVRAAVADVFPEHTWGAEREQKVVLVDPLEYSEFVYLMSGAHFLLTDSGGVQEEAPCLGKPVLVCRESTERPEAVSSGSAICVGTSEGRILEECAKLVTDHTHYAKMAQPRFIFGNGDAAKKIVALL